VIRRWLQAGRGRTLSTLVVSAGTFAAIIYGWGRIEIAPKPLECLQKVAFVAAAFSVTAYNLRTRVIDLILKHEGSPERARKLSVTARNCGKKLTNLVLLFTLAALLLGSAGFIAESWPAAKWFTATTVAIFAGSCVQFFYILFAFERLERFVLNEAEFKAGDSEVKRLGL